MTTKRTPEGYDEIDADDVSDFDLDKFDDPKPVSGPIRDLAMGALAGFAGGVLFELAMGPRVAIEDGADFFRIDVDETTECMACGKRGLIQWWRHGPRLGVFYDRLGECRSCGAVFNSEAL
jgi:hypothetical protein